MWCIKAAHNQKALTTLHKQIKFTNVLDKFCYFGIIAFDTKLFIMFLYIWKARSLTWEQKALQF